MIELRGVADFTQKPVGRDRDGELGMQDLDRDLPALRVERAEQGGVAAPPDGGDDVVARAERFLHALDEIAGHAGIGGVVP